LKKITITMELVFGIPEKNLTINSLIQGIKDAKHTILESIMNFKDVLYYLYKQDNEGRIKILFPSRSARRECGGGDKETSEDY